MENYNKKSIWKWILLYVLIAVVAFGLVYYFFFNQNTTPEENSQNQVQNTSETDILPTKLGQCSQTQVRVIETRLIDGATNQSVLGSGSAIKYTNGGYQVSYETIQGIENSRSGDRINLCLLSIPTDCPPNDGRGKFYSATNLRTGETWELPDAEHMCGGA